MSPPGRPKGEYRSAQHEGTPVNAPLERNGVVIDDGFAEAFPMKATRLLITARLGATGSGLGDRLRDFGDRLRLRGRHRTRTHAR
jgi:hypothetical protein